MSQTSEAMDGGAENLHKLSITDARAVDQSATDPDSDDDAPKLKFHPDFLEPSTATIFQSSDGVCFRFDISRLAEVSTFFADLNDVGGLVHGHAANDTVIPLPSASAETLHLTFRLLHHHFKTGYKTAIDFPNHKILDEFIDVVKAYDLEVAADQFIWTFKPSEDPLTSEALLVVSAAGNLCQHFKRVCRLLIATTSLTPWAERHLNHYPDAMAALVNGRGYWLSLRSSFRNAVNEVIDRMHDEHAHIARRNLNLILQRLSEWVLGETEIYSLYWGSGSRIIRERLHALRVAIYE
ncbi:uncharacterized protein LOC62_04G006580 [Vanrija pseudolonga]|uniref:BTB domain-containing protein n=1 Tax=Vanrija pseudolonga TaxID=143232 RepID=A0AAF1BNF7_9TREE|nr:hypothetical protein LOC62_04G006580 [Vanrija pseudolonga]